MVLLVLELALSLVMKVDICIEIGFSSKGTNIDLHHPGSQRNQRIGFNIYLLKLDFINNVYINLYLYLKLY